MEVPVQANNQGLDLPEANFLNMLLDDFDDKELDGLFKLLPPIPEIQKKDPDNLFDSITLEDVRAATFKAFKGHNSKSDVKAFKQNLEENIYNLYQAIKDGSYKQLIGYRKLKKRNHKGKLRLIDSPNLVTRIMEHLWLYLIVPFYDRKDNGNGKNCKPGHGITADIPRNSTLHNQKHLYYDLREFHYLLLIDQRKCYEHITPKIYRKQIKHFTRDAKFIDFGEEIGFINKKLPIGTPTSPYIHHFCLWASDVFIRDNTEWSQRYADDNAIAFRVIEDLQAFKWRLTNFWWYELSLRPKRHMTRILNIDKCPMDYCGFVTHRNPDKGVSDHNKGFCKLRSSTIQRAIERCKESTTPVEKVNRTYSSYFGQLIHGNEFSTLLQIENSNMKLSKLTKKVRITREIDAPEIDISDLLGVTFTLYKYRMKDYKGHTNWIQCLIGSTQEIPLKEDRNREEEGSHQKPESRKSRREKGLPRKTKKLRKIEGGKEYAYEFHGNYQGIISYIKAMQEDNPDIENWFMPIEEA